MLGTNWVVHLENLLPNYYGYVVHGYVVRFLFRRRIIPPRNQSDVRCHPLLMFDLRLKKNWKLFDCLPSLSTSNQSSTSSSPQVVAMIFSCVSDSFKFLLSSVLLFPVSLIVVLPSKYEANVLNILRKGDELSPLLWAFNFVCPRSCSDKKIEFLFHFFFFGFF